MADQVQATTEADIWSSDVLGRKAYADFLTKYLIRKTKEDEKFKPFIIALDANWGAGKTYFITKWQEELQTNSKHASFIFDAWKSDYQTDPLLAFISAFKLALDGHISSLPSGGKLQAQVTEKLRGSLKQVQSALIPIAKHLALGLANKATAGAIDAIVNDENFDLNKLGKDSLGGLGDTLEKCFEKALEEQANKEKLFKEFRVSIEQALILLQDGGNFDLPFIIFVDEIDRCRPNFAVELLECLKHLFDIPGLCFVVSTNLEQLGHSVSGIYGTNFDGRNYLQRFFDVEFTLPLPNRVAYAQLLISEYFPTLSNVYHGLPERGFLNQVDQTKPYVVLQWIAEVFDLDLRSQRKMVELIDASLASVGSNHRIHFMWLSLLAAIKIKVPLLFDLLGKENVNRDSINELWQKNIKYDKDKKFSFPADTFSQGGYSERSVLLKDVLITYYETSLRELIELRRSRQNHSSNTYDYPDSIIQSIESETPNSYNPSQKFYPSIKSYHQLIKCAGHLQDY